MFKKDVLASPMSRLELGRPNVSYLGTLLRLIVNMLPARFKLPFIMVKTHTMEHILCGVIYSFGSSHNRVVATSFRVRL